MDPTKLPTDNLYKFMATAGLTVVAFCIYMFWTVSTSLASRGHELLARHDAEIAKGSAWLAQKNETQKNIDEENQVIGNILHEALDGGAPLDPKVREEIVKLDDRHREIRKSRDADALAFAERIATIGSEAVSIQEDLDQGEHLKALLVVLGVTGLFVSGSGFGLWYRNLQRHLDRSVAGTVPESSSGAD